MAAVAVLALGAAACAGQGGGDVIDWGHWARPAPTVTVRPAAAGGGVVLSASAPTSARWIVDALTGDHMIPEGCPAPALTNMIVLDDAVGHTSAALVWLGGDDVTCLAVIGNVDGGGWAVFGVSLDDMAGWQFPMWLAGRAIFTVFPGDAGKVVIKGDDDHVFGAPHQRAVDFGDGRELTIVEYSYVSPASDAPAPPAKPPSARAQVCPQDVSLCRPTRWIPPRTGPTQAPSAPA
ncbi:hypothetical protein ACFV0O_26005 [Kitasatospora sp. NPDC059577]|uniref:hypothetical protein n=1 Tax=Kitasatospora sp. NPDC059577 TaxID=3346873 RepID=UPI0036A6C90B